MHPGQADDGPPSGQPSLRTICREFPQHAIWREATERRTRYVARRAHTSIHPHTVVTADLAELRAILAAAFPPQRLGRQPAGSSPNIARLYDFLRGGKNHPISEQNAGDAVLADFPEIAALAHANRQFVAGAIAHAAASGITQYPGIGAGFHPAAPASPTPSPHPRRRHRTGRKQL